MTGIATALADEAAARWRGPRGSRQCVVLLADGADLAPLLAVWSRWRQDAGRCAHLHLIALGASGMGRPRHRSDDEADRNDHGAAELRAAWPVPAPGWHAFATDGGCVHWLIAIGIAPQAALRQLVASADVLAARAPGAVEAPCVDTGTATPGNAATTATDRAHWARALARVAAPGARLVVQDGGQRPDHALASAGWRIAPPAMPATAPIDGAAPAWTLADHAPHPAAARRRPSRGIGSGRDDGRVLVVGGGLAGCAVAASLAALGRACTVLDGRGEPAGGASGNPAGLFHGIVTPDDGVHARWYRTAALLAQRRIGAAIATGEVPGALCGVLRLQRARSHGAPVTDAGAMRSMLARLRLPPGYVQALDGPEASARSGVALNVPAWWYPGGGWVDPAAWCRAMLRRAAPLVAWQGDVPVDRLLRTPDGWRLLDAAGNVQGEAATVVLANAGDAWRLLGDPPWPVQRVRGQLSVAAWPSPPGATMQRPLAPDATDRRAHGAGSVTPGPAVALTGAGYLLPPVGDRLVFGATAQPGDDDPNVRPADHRENLQRLHALLHGGHGAAAEPGQAGDAASDPVRVAHAAFASGALGGRTAWRWSAGDRLPAVGAVPDEALAPGRRPDQARHVPRLPGLYVCTALGGRGITSAALAGDLLAAVIVGAPLPVPADLADAVDPARFAARAARRAG